MRNLILILSLLSVSCSDVESSFELYKCKIGELEECATGTNHGACSKPIRTCLGDGIWTSCSGGVIPTSEICDFIDNNCNGLVDEGIRNSCGSCGLVPLEVCDGHDNNCNGMVDEGLSGNEELCNGLDDDCDQLVDEGLTKRVECAPEGAGDWIVYDNTHCELGWKQCLDGNWSQCYDFVPPEEEVCDGVDNNCNGVVDEYVVDQSCGTSDVGICQMGVEGCITGEIYCIGGVYPQAETCNDFDDNCNGQVDEDLVRECETLCENGLEYCDGGAWVDCTARVPVEEICDGIDNDCNGEIDDNLICECIEGDIKACRAVPCGWGVQICVNGEFTECSGQSPLPETCNNFDDNCNGIIDEDLYRECYDADYDFIGVGVCVEGSSQCEMGIWQNCEDQILPSQELCDGIDNDCDGVVDNLEHIFEKVDMVFLVDISGSMAPFITAIKDGLSSLVLSLEGTQHHFGIIVFGDYDGRGAPRLYTNLTGIGSFVAGLDMLIMGGGIEPSIDAVYGTVNPSNILGIDWREDATPIIVLLGDENPQNELPLVRSDIIPFTQICSLPGCNSNTNNNWTEGAPTEIYAFIDPEYFEYWRGVIFSSGNRVFNIHDLVVQESLEENIEILFRSLCVD